MCAMCVIACKSVKMRAKMRVNACKNACNNACKFACDNDNELFEATSKKK